MSKYAPLWQYLQVHRQESYKLSFAEIKQILGFSLDHSFLSHKKELLDYGYAVEKISMKAQIVTFRKIS